MPSFARTHRTSISADRATIHGLVDDLHQWERWSPWEGLDADLERTYTGPGAGEGARYAWSGNKKAGSGAMEITESAPDHIDIDLEFTAPFKARNRIRFDFAARDDATDVAWTLSGERNPVMHLLGVALFDRSVGKDFDRGLAQLKSVAEQA